MQLKGSLPGDQGSEGIVTPNQLWEWARCDTCSPHIQEPAFSTPLPRTPLCLLPKEPCSQAWRLAEAAAQSPSRGRERSPEAAGQSFSHS